MKRMTLTILCILLLAGCFAHEDIFRTSAKIPAVPEEPHYRQIVVHPIDGGLCMDTENVAILMQNIQALRGYCEELRRILRDLKEGGER